MAKMVINGVAELKALAGKDVGSTEWKTMTQERVRTFADATDDHQWIHVDVERAKKESPFGGPVAHGYLSLSFVAGLFFELVETRGFKMTVNYGANKVRFPNPLKVGQRYRLTLKVGDVKEVNEWVEAIIFASVDIEGQAKPAVAAEVIYRFLP